MAAASTGEIKGPAAKFDKIFASYEDTPDVPFPLAPIGKDFPYKSWFRGVVIGGETKAYPEDLLYKQSEIEDVVGGVPIVVISNIEKQRLRFFARDAEELTSLPDIRLYWFSWKSIYPDTAIYSDK